MNKQNNINKGMEYLNNVADEFHRYREEHYLLTDHIVGLIAWTLFVLILIQIFFTVFQKIDNPKVETPKPYYSNAETFCEHYGMIYESGFFDYGKCVNVTSDVYKYKLIDYKNNRYYFLEGEE